MRKSRAHIAGLVPTGCLVALLVVLISPREAPGAESIRLSGVPSRLALPLPEGTNQILTATVKGGKIRDVWLARERNARGRVLLSRVDEGEYQINLADPVVEALLRTTGEGGQFQIFAEMRSENVIASIPVRFTVGERPFTLATLEEMPRIYVHTGRKSVRVSPLPLDALRLRPEEFGLWLLAGEEWEGKWFSPDEVTRIEVRFERNAAAASASAEIGEQRLPFARTDRETSRTLTLTPAIRRDWKRERCMTVRCAAGGSEVYSTILKVPPETLDLPGGSARVTVTQRCSKAIPGSDGYLSLKLDDITGGQVLLILRKADGEVIIDGTSVRRGDELPFTFNRERYWLSVEKLENFLIGDDYGIFKVSTTQSAETKKIERLLDRVKESAIVFVREGREYSGSEAADHLRGKLRRAGARIATLDEFIDSIASRSATTGKPYRIRPRGGEMVNARAWLREQARKLAGEQQPGPQPSETAPAETAPPEPTLSATPRASVPAGAASAEPASGGRSYISYFAAGIAFLLGIAATAFFLRRRA